MFPINTPASRGVTMLDSTVSLENTLRAVPHQYLNLHTADHDLGDCHRPNLSVWAAADEDRPPAVVTLHVGPLLGQSARYVDMTPDEAELLGRYLIEAAALIRRETETV